MLRICEGAALRVLTGTPLRWCCFYNGGFLPWHGHTEKLQALLTPKKAVWDEAEKVSADFCLKVSLQGQLSFSGQLAGLDNGTKRKIKKAVEFYKKHQKLIQCSIREQLTPIASIQDRSGWSAFYIHSSDCREGLFFAFRLDSSETAMRFRLPAAALGGHYRITDYDTGETFEGGAEELSGSGIVPEIPEKNSGIILYFLNEARRL
jgi:hypothetical protein